MSYCKCEEPEWKYAYTTDTGWKKSYSKFYKRVRTATKVFKCAICGKEGYYQPKYSFE